VAWISRPATRGAPDVRGARRAGARSGPGGSYPRAPAAPSQQASASSKAPPGSTGPVQASPAARRLAADQGVDLRRVKGTGKAGFITATDVRDHLTVPR